MRTHVYRNESEGVQKSATPITEDTFKRQDWDKHVEGSGNGEHYYFTLPLPKNNPDPESPILISSFSHESEMLGLMNGNYVVEIADFFGLGICYTEEQLEKLYRILTNSHIEESK